jgi:hypothetical protein
MENRFIVTVAWPNGKLFRCNAGRRGIGSELSWPTENRLSPSQQLRGGAKEYQVISEGKQACRLHSRQRIIYIKKLPFGFGHWCHQNRLFECLSKMICSLSFLNYFNMFGCKPLTEYTPEPVVLDDFKSTRFQKHEVRARAFPTLG